MIMLPRLIYPLFCLFLIVCYTQVSAREVIQNYHSDIVIESNSSINVTETITVNAEGNEIKRGIFRDFPTRYKDPFGNTVGSKRQA